MTKAFVIALTSLTILSVAASLAAADPNGSVDVANHTSCEFLDLSDPLGSPWVACWSGGDEIEPGASVQVDGVFGCSTYRELDNPLDRYGECWIAQG